ncbi:MAG: SDR family oxidoreductase [Acidobacteria bacterium]|nr:SDR family oxidoreductase [Acidobacteriota bacterium]
MACIFVTGGGRGIGRAVALAFAEPGATVAIASRTRDQLDRTARDIRDRGADAMALEMDVTDSTSVQSALSRLQSRGTPIDILVNNAGVGGGEPVEGSDESAWRRIIDTNVVGTYLVCRAALPLVAEGGRIINLSSVLGRFGVPGYTAYCASKHAIIGFTRALALELTARSITVNAISPGWVDTDMAVEGMTLGADAMGVSYEEFRRRAIKAVPIKRIIQPEEVAGLVRFLASPAAAAITGQTYNICGGQVMS